MVKRKPCDHGNGRIKRLLIFNTYQQMKYNNDFRNQNKAPQGGYKPLGLVHGYDFGLNKLINIKYLKISWILVISSS